MHCFFHVDTSHFYFLPSVSIRFDDIFDVTVFEITFLVFTFQLIT